MGTPCNTAGMVIEANREAITSELVAFCIVAVIFSTDLIVLFDNDMYINCDLTD